MDGTHAPTRTWWLVCCMVVSVLHQVHLRLWVHGSMGIVRPKTPEKNKDHECKHNTERNSSSSTDAIGASIPK